LLPSYSRAFQKQPQDAYERLLLDCMRGDATLFARRDAVELAWKLVDPILQTWQSEAPEVGPCDHRCDASEPCARRHVDDRSGGCRAALNG
jgi:glucose-6-phosphate 1-dehydrogenase